MVAMISFLLCLQVNLDEVMQEERPYSNSSDRVPLLTELNEIHDNSRYIEEKGSSDSTLRYRSKCVEKDGNSESPLHEKEAHVIEHNGIDSEIVTEKDFLGIGRNIPVKDGKWKQILIGCFGIEENDIGKAEYACQGEGLEMVITKALTDWHKRQPNPKTKEELFRILARTKEKGICKNSSWYAFLAPALAQDQVETDNGELNNDSANVGPVKDFLIRELNNPEYWCMMLMSSAMELFYTKLDHNSSYEALCYALILPLVVLGDYRKLVPFENYLSEWVITPLLPGRE